MGDPMREIEVSYNRLRGRALGAIESWGLARDPGGETREAAMKTLMKQLTYDSQAEISDLVMRIRQDAISNGLH